MDIEYTCQIWREAKQYIAHATPLDVLTSGPTPNQARAALDEAVRAFLHTAREMGTLDQILEECGYTRDGERWLPPEWIAVERSQTRLSA